jgi:hypothetical protein
MIAGGRVKMDMAICSLEYPTIPPQALGPLLGAGCEACEATVLVHFCCSIVAYLGGVCQLASGLFVAFS